MSGRRHNHTTRWHLWAAWKEVRHGMTIEDLNRPYQMSSLNNNQIPIGLLDSYLKVRQDRRFLKDLFARALCSLLCSELLQPEGNLHPGFSTVPSWLCSMFIYVPGTFGQKPCTYTHTNGYRPVFAKGNAVTASKQHSEPSLADGSHARQVSPRDSRGSGL